MGLDCLSGYELGGTEVCLFAITGKWKTVEIAEQGRIHDYPSPVRVGTGQELYLGSLDNFGRGSETKDRKNPKK